MTIEELQIAKELYVSKAVVDNKPSIHQNSDSNNDSMADIRDNRISIEYQASLTDPRRI